MRRPFGGRYGHEEATAGWCIAVNRRVPQIAWYRFRVTWRRRRGGYLTVVLLVGLLGGLAMATVAAARRTQSSFPAFLARTNSSDLAVSLGSSGGQGGNGYFPDVLKQAPRLPHVKGAESAVIVIYSALVTPGGTHQFDVTAPILGSVDGAFFNHDRFTVTRGRMAKPDRADEIMVNELEAEKLGLHVGQVVNVEVDSTKTNGPQEHVDVKVVGIGVGNSGVVQDDVDRSPLIIATPAFTRPLLDCCVYGTLLLVQLDHGSRDVPIVEREFRGALPQQIGFQFQDESLTVAQAERAIKPEALALGVFGAIAAAATLVIAGQAVARQLRIGAEDLGVLRALGADPRMTASDGLAGNVGAVVIGSLLAVVVGVALSPLAPIGPVRKVGHAPGVAVDWTVLGVGLAVLIVGLGAVAIATVVRESPHRVARREQVALRGSSVVRMAGSSGLPAPAVAGIGFALDAGRGRTAVPVRSAMAGAALATIVMVTTLTFGSSLHTLVSRPALYGWNWSYALQSEGPIPPQTQTMLDHDPDVAAWSGEYFVSVQLDNQPVPAIAATTGASVAPPILSGHALDAPDQIVLGAATLAHLHKHVGDTVAASLASLGGPSTSGPSQSLRIVGTATMPAVASSGVDHTSMGTGALLATKLLPDSVLHTYGALSGPATAFVRFRDGANPTAARRSLQRITDTTNRMFAANPDFSTFGTVVALLPVQHPAEIVNYRSMGDTPAILAGGLAAGAIVALGLTLAASVRRRRRDLALLKTLGFTRRQLAATVGWQASIPAIIGITVGVPVGIALGRWLWILFAREIYAVPEPTVPVVSVVFVALGALVLANLVAALPGRSAARTPAALVLRTE